MTALFLGVDLGTSGIRCAATDAQGKVIGMARAPYPDASAQGWWQAVSDGLHALRTDIGPDAMRAIRSAAVGGTSGTMVLVDAALNPVTAPLMYNSNGFDAEAQVIADCAPPDHITRGSASALGRALRLQSQDSAHTATHLCHQADFILAKLAGRAGHSDENNCLKTGYDVVNTCWPDWFARTGLRTELLPDVHPVGTAIGQVDPAIAQEFGFAPELILRVGTTDSIAAFLAAGADTIGDVVTSFGTTLAIKMLSDRRIDDPARGIYSHKLGAMWLVGGASNTGGGALLAHFTPDEMTTLSARMDPTTDTGLTYYPLPRKGERFPIADPDLEPSLTPRPQDDVLFLQGLFEGITRIEAQCYDALRDLGAPPITRILSAGGGARNDAWRAIRQRHIPYPITVSHNTEASVGLALLCASHANASA
ncbi:FGGY-family carbohydrate kinase [Marivita sp. S6314]|uniref:FGGY-family carbohydrate kinase n=1 Tax=Marivita sp. S6314 TaxID=2926406 RepID=UPI001FF53959|nr:FGGY-family carbohydrate kinase [Marivita sp. S6314]MCK0149210.1 FGGY-family carbohydrate kinase [Marivita sp. S6314]